MTHREFCYVEMKRLLDKHLDPEAKLTVMDLGSWNRNGPDGSMRPLMSSQWEYTGVDVRGGKCDNVDANMPAEYEIPFPDNHFDVIVTMACFEHVHNPFNLMAEASRVLKRGGLFFFSAPFIHPPHDHFDGWRFLPKGVRVLFKESNINKVEAYLLPYENLSDCWAVGRQL